nr:MAG TPA: Integrase [Caudoviricetes sp.]
MANAVRLPSGRWRVKAYDYKDGNGKEHYVSFTADTKKEAEYQALLFSMNKKKIKTENQDLTLEKAMLNYCEMKSNVLSPSTLANYKRLIYNSFDGYLHLSIKKFDSELIQKWVNTYSKNRTPKTVRNTYGFLFVVLKSFLLDLSIKVTLPQKVKPTLYVPTDNDIKAIINYLSDNDTEMLKAVYLAAFGTLRRSEICALTAADTEKNVIHVNKALVMNEQREWVTKTTKTVSSIRDVDLPEQIIKVFPKTGRLVDINPSVITHRFAKTLKTLNIKHFRFHDLRHYAASMLHAIGVPDVYIMQKGGWSSDGTLKRIYRGVMDDYKEKFDKKAFEHIDSLTSDRTQNRTQKIKKP